MPGAAAQTAQPTRARKIIATVFVVVTVFAVWKVIDYRTKPPPPPHPVGERQPAG